MRTRLVRVAGRSIPATKLEFDLLAQLLAHRGQVVTYSELGQRIWGYDDDSIADNIRTTVYRLRQSLTGCMPPEFIRAVRGVGYVIDAPARDGRHPLLNRSALEAALRQHVTPTMLVDADASMVLANDALSELTGRPVEVLERLPSWQGVVDSSSWSKAQSALVAASDGCAARPAEVAVCSSTGNPPIARFTVHPIHDNGSVAGLMVTLHPAAPGL